MGWLGTFSGPDPLIGGEKSHLTDKKGKWRQGKGGKGFNVSLNTEGDANEKRNDAGFNSD